jgi:uncharacterized membrane protein YdjX (TVP38/TMEM64 family)
MKRRIRWLAPRLFAAAAIALAIGLMWHWRALFEPAAIEAMLADHPWAPIAFVAAHIVISLTFVPRTVLAIAAGLLWGLWWGTFWAMVGAMAGAWAGFGLVRLIGGERLRFLHIPALTPWLDRLERGGWRAVWAIRLLPLPHTPVNYAFGLTPISWSAYSWGSLLGIIPSTVIAVAAGAAGGQALGGTTTGWIVPAAVGGGALVVSLLLTRL